MVPRKLMVMMLMMRMEVDDADDDDEDDDDDGRDDDECFARQVEGRGNLHAGRFVATASFGPSPPLRRDESRGALAPTGRTGAVR